MVGTPSFSVHDLEVVPRADAAIDVRAEHVQALAFLGDEIDVLQVAVGDGHGAVRIPLLDLADDLPEQGVEKPRPGGVALALGQRLDLERGPGQAVVVLVAQQPHQHARGVLELVDHRQDLGLQGRAHRGIAVVGRGVPDAVHGQAVAPHGIVQDRVDAVLLVDVLHPARRHAHVLADGVDAHLLQQGHLHGQGGLDDVVGLGPEAVGVVLADGHVAPVHAEDHEVPAVDLQARAACVRDHLDSPAGAPLRGDGGQAAAGRRSKAPARRERMRRRPRSGVELHGSLLGLLDGRRRRRRWRPRRHGTRRRCPWECGSRVRSRPQRTGRTVCA